MIKNIIAIVCGVALTISLAGCGSSQTKSANAQVKSTSNNTQSQTSQSSDSSANSSGSTSQGALAQAFQDELNGFTTIEQDVKKSDYASAKKIADQLHNEFHAEILPPLKAKKGNTYAENIHSKYDEMQDAVTNKDDTKITQLIKVNRDNLHTVAKILGVTIK